MYILGLCSSWGTSQICPSWSPSEHLLAPALSPFGEPRVQSHAIQKRLFIVFMTAAHISPNIFSLRKFLSNIQGLFLCYIIISFILIIHHIHTHIYIFYFTCLYSKVHLFGSPWQARCPRLLVSDTVSVCTHLNLGLMDIRLK
jgi:hypothetical protein